MEGSMITTTRQCERCGLTLVRKRYPGGRVEHTTNFALRRTCGLSCPPRRPEPVPVFSFTRTYEAALAQGVDLLETFDAAWED
jgi:hypothetical protein